MPFKEKIAVHLSSNAAKRETNSAIKAKIIHVTDDRGSLTQLCPFRHRDVGMPSRHS